MTATERRQGVRAILAGQACVHPASVFDPISARLAAGIGFEMGMLAGSVASFTVLGAPDLVLLTLTEFAEQIRRICRAAPLPLLVDADHGYGNALSAMRTVQELEAAGVAALTIEDTQLPTPFGAAGPALISREEGAGKLRAALAAREDPATVIVARTGAAGIAGVEEAIARARLYAPLGPDALFLTGIKDATALRAVAEAVRLPIILGGGMLGLDRAGLAAHGVRIALQGHQPFGAAVEAVRATLQALRDGVAPEQFAGVAKPALMGQVTHEAEYRAWTQTFLGAPP
ncbi:MAG: isocitrate lyase/PEP mutase family protein [Alphaproteobacteria bacterium]|nr:isocitrate lyase/PEP mutase family protein [Alphaproteobacteria bacterium]